VLGSLHDRMGEPAGTMRRQPKMRAVAATLAAYGLVLQALLMGLVLGSTAAPASGSRPAWAILCNPSGIAVGQDGAPSGSNGGRAPTCCIAGACGLSFGLPGAPVALPPVPAQVAHRSLGPETRIFFFGSPRGHLPQARAPPSLV